MNWSQESVDKVAKELRFLPNIWSKDTLASARKILSVIDELPEVRGLLEAALKLLAACGNGFVNEGVESSEEKELKKALAPFTNKGEPL